MQSLSWIIPLNLGQFLIKVVRPVSRAALGTEVLASGSGPVPENHTQLHSEGGRCQSCLSVLCLVPSLRGLRIKHCIILQVCQLPGIIRPSCSSCLQPALLPAAFTQSLSLIQRLSSDELSTLPRLLAVVRFSQRLHVPSRPLPANPQLRRLFSISSQHKRTSRHPCSSVQASMAALTRAAAEPSMGSSSAAVPGMSLSNEVPSAGFLSIRRELRNGCAPLALATATRLSRGACGGSALIR